MNPRISFALLAPLVLGILADMVAPDSPWLSPAATSISGFLFWFWAFPVSARGAFIGPLLVGVLFVSAYLLTGITNIILFQSSSYFSHRVLIGAMGVGPLAFATVAIAVQWAHGRRAGGA